MTVGELRDQLVRLDDSMPVMLWNDNDGTTGDAAYTTGADGKLTICGRMS